METLIAPTINLLILVAILFIYLRQPIQAFVRDRHRNIQDELARVRDFHAQAQQRHAEFTAKLQSMQTEIGGMRDQARKDGEATRARIVAEAQRVATTIVADARQSASNLYGDLRTTLYIELAGRVMERAEILMREKLTGEDKARIRQEFSRQLEVSQ